MIHPRDCDDGATTTVVTDRPDSRRPGESLPQLVAVHPSPSDKVTATTDAALASTVNGPVTGIA